MINFRETLRLLKIRGKAMQNAVPIGEGGMVAVLGVKIEYLDKIMSENKKKFNCFLLYKRTACFSSLWLKKITIYLN